MSTSLQVARSLRLITGGSSMEASFLSYYQCLRGCWPRYLGVECVSKIGSRTTLFIKKIIRLTLKMAVGLVFV